jgi:hypothetical protein
MKMDLRTRIRDLAEPEVWQLLQELVASPVELSDQDIRSLDGRMQGFLFLQDHVGNRQARIDFVRAASNMDYLRDAAGSRNVWMTDEEFSEFVERNDSATLACFARSELMQPHHLFYIAQLLGRQPHHSELLATADDARITLKKALELQGNASGMALIRLASDVLLREAGADEARRLDGRPSRMGDPRGVWRAYLNLKGMDPRAVAGWLTTSNLPTTRPPRTSRASVRPLN